MTNTILVLGGTGKTGGRVTRCLRQTGLPIRTASRFSGDCPFDLGIPATWRPALEGVSAVYVVEPDLQAGIEDPVRVPGFVAEAVASGVSRLVLLSAYGVGDAESHPLKPAEESVRTSGVAWTILRPDWFSQNFSESFWLPGVLEGELRLPTGDGGTPFVDADDIADVAAASLIDDRHAGETFQLTGPRSISFGEAAALIGHAAGRQVRHIDIDPDAFEASRVAAGSPAAVARALTGVYAAVRDGKGAAVSDGVERALGRQPKRFEDYVMKTAATGVWNQERLIDPRM